MATPQSFATAPSYRRGRRWTGWIRTRMAVVIHESAASLHVWVSDATQNRPVGSSYSVDVGDHPRWRVRRHAATLHACPVYRSLRDAVPSHSSPFAGSV